MIKILKSNLLLIAISVTIICYFISFLSNDIVLTDKIYQKFLDEKYEEKYNEFKDLDVDLADFEDELRKFEQTTENKSYGWDEFYVDSVFVVIPLLLVTLGFSTTFLLLILFNKRLHIINYPDILRVTLISYVIFYFPEIISAIYFLIFKKDYELKDIHNLESYFGLNKFFDKDITPSWIWDIVSQTGIVYLVFPLIVGLLLSIIYKDLKRPILIGYSYLSYLLVFVFYNTVFWYLFDLV